jgi:hypothetical protein
MKIRTLALLTVGLLATLAPSARAAFIVNGGFTDPVVTGTYETFAVGSMGITGWTVISGVNNAGQGSVDLLTAAFITPPVLGQQTVDLDGTGGNPAGGVAQLVSGLGANTAYTLTFSYSNNPNGASSSALVTVLDGIGGTSLGSTTVTHAGALPTLPQYQVGSVTFVTDSTGSAYISFASKDPASDYNGIILGNVALNAVPEPASCAMLGLGLLAVGAYARRRKV